MNKYAIQAGMLTPQQKRNLPEIYKKFIASILTVAIISLVLAVGTFVICQSKASQAVSEAQEPQYSLTLGSQTTEIRSADYYEAEQTSNKMRRLSFILLAAFAVAGMVIILIVNAVFKKNYPYFSEGVYRYIKKTDPSAFYS